jgi:hypothetical protein
MASATYTARNNLLGKAPFAMKAGEAITVGRALKLDSTEGQVLHTTAITDVAIGVALETVASGDMVSIAPPGTIVKMVPGAAVSLGAQVMPEASGAGKVITAAGATAIACGVAMTEAGAEDELFEVLFLSGVKTPANS